MTHTEQRIIRLKIECSELPPHDWGGQAEIWLGIQCGKEVVQEVKLPSASVAFEAELRVSGVSAEAKPNFLGPYAHGTVQDRFLYLCWGRRHAGQWIGFRRVKLPLSSLSWEDLKSGRLTARLRCTDKKGGPICATVREPFLTWSPSIL